MNEHFPELPHEIAQSKLLSDETVEKLKKATTQYKERLGSKGQAQE